MSQKENRRRPSKSASKPRSHRPAPAPLQPLDIPPDIQSFDEWPGLGADVLGAIKEMGITIPTPIQALSIGAVLAGKDMIAKAETGTGKTLAFGAPMVAKVDPARRSVLGLVLSPTRELAEQVFQVLATLGAKRGLKCNLIVGGEPMQPQVKGLQGGAQIVVGTPGRVLDLMQQGFLSFPWTEFVVLDEADKMLEIGFIDDVKKILEASNEYRQTLLFSATFPPALLEMARAYTRDPLEVATSSGVSTADTVEQYYLEVGEDDRAQDLRNLIRASGPKDVFLVFCDRRTDVDRLIRRLERERFSVKALHGGYDQASRFRVMDAFRTGEVKVLVATDVASRGLDVNHVTHVVNLNAPRDVSDYTHRIGRTGRAGRAGTSITFVGGIDRRRWREVTDALPKPVAKLRSVFDLFEAPKARERKRNLETEETPSRPSKNRGDEVRPVGRSERSDERPDRKVRERDRTRPAQAREREPHADEAFDEERPHRSRVRSRERSQPDPIETQRPKPPAKSDWATLPDPLPTSEAPRPRRTRVVHREEEEEREPRERKSPSAGKGPRRAAQAATDRKTEAPIEKPRRPKATSEDSDRTLRDPASASRERKPRVRREPRAQDAPLQEGAADAKRSAGRKPAPAPPRSNPSRSNSSPGGFGEGL